MPFDLINYVSEQQHVVRFDKLRLCFSDDIPVLWRITISEKYDQPII
jgi:hypothetical protein